MPIIDVSGLTTEEKDVKNKLRREIQKYFAKKLGIKEDSTAVTFITDDTITDQEHIIARLHSKSFMKMGQEELDEISDDVVAILEEAGHPYNEAFPIPVMAMRGRFLK